MSGNDSEKIKIIDGPWKDALTPCSFRDLLNIASYGYATYRQLRQLYV